MTKITFRSYDIEKNHYGAPQNPAVGGENFETVVEHIFQSNFSDRVKRVIPNCFICLSRYEPEQNGNKIFGEFIRIRNSDFPMMVDENGVDRIPMPDENNNIGKGAVFCYDVLAGRLYMQYSNTIVTDSCAMYYLNMFSQFTAFHAVVRPRADVWGQLERGSVRKVMIRVGSPDNPEVLVGDRDADDDEQLENILTTIKEVYNAPSIYIEMSVGRVRERSLAVIIKDQLRIMCNNGLGRLFELKSAKAEVEEDGTKEVINLIDDVLSTQEDIDLPKNDPEENYRKRKELLVELMARNAFVG